MTSHGLRAPAGARSRSGVFAAACVGMAFAAVVILAYSEADVSRMTSGDGLFYRYVAENMDIDKADLDPVVAARGPSLRYGRIALPALIWLFSAGSPDAMPYAQPVIMILAAGAIAVAAKKLFPDRGPLVSLVPFLALGVTLSIAGGYTEALAVAFAVWAVVAARSERWIATSALLALAMLSRENAAVVAIGLAVWCVARRRWVPLALVALSVVPVAAWHLVVAERFGHLPLADPYLWAGAETARIPFVSLIKGFADYSAAAALTAAIHTALWVVALALAISRRTLLAIVAAAAGLQLAAVPLLNWSYVGDTFRLFSFLEIFTVLTLASASSLRRGPENRA